jgi:hypothetical protein
MLNFTFVHKYTAATLNTVADSSEAAWLELEELIFNSEGWYLDSVNSEDYSQSQEMTNHLNYMYDLDNGAFG